MATTLDSLVTQVRRFVRDWPLEQDTLLVSLGASSSTVVVSDTSVWPTGGRTVLEIGYEAMVFKSISSSSLTVTRSYAGSTAASYAASTTILKNPSFLAVDIIDALNAARDEMFPLVYQPVLDTSLSADSTTYEFTVPNMPTTYGGDSVPIPYLSKIELLVSGDTAYREVRDWKVRRGATPKIQFRRPPTAGTLRVHGVGPFPDWSAASDTVNGRWPKNAERPLVLGAASRLVASGEAGRTRADTGLRDDREAANRPGMSISLANQLERRFEKALLRAGQPPLGPHLVSTF